MKKQKELVPVTDCKFRDKSFIDSNHIRVEAIHNILRHVGGVVHGESLLGKAIHGRRVSWGVIWAEDLLSDGLKWVARIRVHIVRLILEEEALGVWISCGQRVGLRAIHTVDFWIDSLHPTQHVVKWPVLHHNYNNGFDGIGMDWTVKGYEHQKQDWNGGASTHWINGMGLDWTEGLCRFLVTNFTVAWRKKREKDRDRVREVLGYVGSYL